MEPGMINQIKFYSTKFFIYTVLLYSTVFFSCTVHAQQVAVDVLDDVVITKADYNAVIKVLFKRPITYLSHSPESEGKTINIVINLPGTRTTNAISTIRSESIRVNSDTGLTDVVFENVSNTSNSILLYFTKNVSYDVIQGNDHRSLSIIIYGQN